MKTREHLTLDGVFRKAWYSACEQYRYALLIQWDASRKPKCLIGLNPSSPHGVRGRAEGGCFQATSVGATHARMGWIWTQDTPAYSATPYYLGTMMESDSA